MKIVINLTVDSVIWKTVPKKMRGSRRDILEIQEAFIRSMFKNLSINSDLEDAFSLSSRTERETVFLNRLVIEDVNLNSE